MLAAYVLTITLMLPVSGTSNYDHRVEKTSNLTLEQCLEKGTARLDEASKKGENVLVSCKLQDK
ncbi:MAG: hypothetical protein E4H14_03075 [Candidatus Thorarchaeota archaeon]|nr:MAG: hypothetical protein E4H14_03075 [Candidatus Thorarchaeota archaeon]